MIFLSSSDGTFTDHLKISIIKRPKKINKKDKNFLFYKNKSKDLISFNVSCDNKSIWIQIKGIRKSSLDNTSKQICNEIIVKLQNILPEYNSFPLLKDVLYIDKIVYNGNI